MDGIEFLKDSQVSKRLSVSRASIWRWAAMGKFPAPVKLSEGVSRWRLADIEEWENAKAAQSKAAPIDTGGQHA